MRGHLLDPLKRRIASPRPADRVVRLGMRPADVGEDLHVVCQRGRDAVEIHHLIGRPRKASFGARTVVAHNEKDERVVGVRKFLDGVEQATAFVIRKREIASEVFHKRRE